MEFFASLINEVGSLTENLPQKAYPYTESKSWKDIGYNQVIMQRDTAFELNGTGFNLVTTAPVESGVTVIGKELSEIKEGCSFARVSLIQLQENSDEQAVYNLIRKVEYVKYHFFPEGYMMRTTSRSHKESVRVSKKAVKEGISFEKVGNLLINKYKENPAVKSVKVLFITDTAADFRALQQIAEKNNRITETLNHVMNSVTFDCDTCNLKAVCDEVEGMKELHFKNKGRGM